MNNEENKLCNFCKIEKPLFKAISRFFVITGWQEETFYACKDCMKLEDLHEVVEIKDTIKKSQKAA